MLERLGYQADAVADNGREAVGRGRADAVTTWS